VTLQVKTIPFQVQLTKGEEEELPVAPEVNYLRPVKVFRY
jgi:hypothetical protein